MNDIRLSVIIPALNESVLLPATLARIAETLPDAEVVVADGGSDDRTREIARDARALPIDSARGRGRQCRAGAEQACGDWLLFLHADTLLPRNAASEIEAFVARPNARIATFRLRFDAGSFFLRACARCSRFDSVFTRFGDQGILVRYDFYDAIGGFPDWPLMEDVELLRRARRRARIESLPAFVETSARRFRKHRELTRQARNAVLLLRFLTGTSPETLARSYNEERKAPSDSVAGAREICPPPVSSS